MTLESSTMSTSIKTGSFGDGRESLWNELLGSQEPPNDLEQVALVEIALDYIGIRAHLDAVFAIFGRAQGRHQHNRQLLELLVGSDPGGELEAVHARHVDIRCLLYTSPSPRDRTRSRMPSSA